MEIKKILMRFLIFIAIITLSAPAVADQVTMEDAFSPHQGATALVVKTINGAKRSVSIAAYSFTSKPIATALVAAHDRGIDVEIILDKSQVNGRTTRYVSDHGIPTRINYR